mmetsp:Transcript_11738/g.32518  ORF Transcript_11738/g.32518 Transcript_11738/m.32518 type:complete len:136 (-) Transcript_11738:109-516(-)
MVSSSSSKTPVEILLRGDHNMPSILLRLARNLLLRGNSFHRPGLRSTRDPRRHNSKVDYGTVRILLVVGGVGERESSHQSLCWGYRSNIIITPRNASNAKRNRPPFTFCLSSSMVVSMMGWMDGWMDQMMDQMTD